MRALSILIAIALAAPLAKPEDPHVPIPPVVEVFSPRDEMLDKDAKPIVKTWTSKGQKIEVWTFKHKRQSANDHEWHAAINEKKVLKEYPRDPEPGVTVILPKPDDLDEGIGSLPK